MGKSFYKPGEVKGLSYVKIPLRTNALVIRKNDDKYCFIWSKLASLHPCNNDHPNRVSNHKQYFNELNSNSFGFSDGFKCSDMHKFEKLNNLSIQMFELNFHQEKNKWKHKLIPIEMSKNDSDRVVDLLFYKNHYVLIKKLNVFLGKQDCRYICKRCFSSYTCKNMIIKHKQQCFQKEITKIRTSPQSHYYWKNFFHKNTFYIFIFIKTLRYKQTSKLIMKTKTAKLSVIKQLIFLSKIQYVMVINKLTSELEDVLKSGYYISPLGHENFDWFVDEIIKLENKMTFYFSNTKKDIIKTQKYKEDLRKSINCRFCERELLDIEVRDQCHLTGKYRCPAHSKCNNNVKQSQSNFIKNILHSFSNYDCRLFFKT